MWLLHHLCFRPAIFFSGQIRLILLSIPHLNLDEHLKKNVSFQIFYIFSSVRKIFESRVLAPSYLSARPSVRMEQISSHRTDFHGNRFLDIFRKSVEKIKIYQNRTRIADNLHEDQYTFSITPHSVILRTRNLSHKLVDKTKTHKINSVTSPPPKIVPFMIQCEKNL